MKCAHKVWPKPGFRSFPCDRAAKFVAVRNDGAEFPVCGTHANVNKRLGYEIRPADTANARQGE